MRNCTKLSVMLFALLLISGCSQKFNDLNATLKEAAFGFDDVEMTKEQVSNLPYASIQARINQGPLIFMVLAFAELNPATGHMQLKWVSSDHAMIVTENGRIVKTINLPSANLASVTLAQTMANSGSFQALYDWTPDYSYSQPVIITSKEIGKEDLSSLIWQQKTTLVQENLAFSKTNSNYTNQYWQNSDDHTLKSSQWLIPNKLHIEYEVLKPYHK
ncbi:YjbF family lipoprotein [Vibrio sinensis]|uniref:YjbF family lipoprotein n=1 Tax=Vibrio sinensis TaxID=2302434 RepID=A0A3A6QJ75_9VIBR|nr:YjbF family lipoprotein [Vibrio sinensis]RJX67162.1 YjbF family lipoprotein [Vibrio sinensis]